MYLIVPGAPRLGFLNESQASFFLNGLLVALVSLLLVVALVLEYGWELEPCLLCMVQRFWLVMVGLTAVVSLLLRAQGWWRQFWAVTTIVAAGTGAGFAWRQLWLQSLPPEARPSCSPGLDYVLNYMPLGDAINLMIQGSGECAEVLFRFLGLSIPAWSLIGFLGLLILASLHFFGAKPKTVKRLI